MILRILANMFFWTVIKGSVRDSLKRGDRGVRRRVYMYLALCVLGVLLLSACGRKVGERFPAEQEATPELLIMSAGRVMAYVIEDSTRGVTCYISRVGSGGISCVRTRP